VIPLAPARRNPRHTSCWRTGQPQDSSGIGCSRIATEFPDHRSLKRFRFFQRDGLNFPDHLMLPGEVWSTKLGCGTCQSSEWLPERLIRLDLNQCKDAESCRYPPWSESKRPFQWVHAQVHVSNRSHSCTEPSLEFGLPAFLCGSNSLRSFTCSPDRERARQFCLRARVHQISEADKISLGPQRCSSASFDRLR